MFDKNGRCEVVDSPGFAKELVDNFRWMMDSFSGKTSHEDRQRVIYTLVDTAQHGYRKIMTALLYGILTEDEHTKYYDHICNHDRDNYGYLISVMNQIVKYRGFELYSRKTIDRILWLITIIIDENRESTVNAGLYEVIECLLRQICGGDLSESNIWLCEKMLDLLKRESAWLFQNERLIHITFYTFASLAREHDRFDQLRTREAQFCKIIFDNHYNVCFKIGRDLYRLLFEVSNIPDFAAIYNNLDHNAKLLIIRKPTVDYCLSSRLTNDEKARITAYLENHTPKAFLRKFETFFRDFSVSGYTLVDIIRWICCAFRSIANQLFYAQREKEPSSEIKQSIMGLSKTALILDWLSFDRNNPTIRLIIESYRADSQFGSELIEFLGSSINNFPPVLEPEIRENVRVAAQTVLRRNIMTIEDLNMIRSKANDGRANRIILEIWGNNKQTDFEPMNIQPTITRSNTQNNPQFGIYPLHNQASSSPSASYSSKIQTDSPQSHAPAAQTQTLSNRIQPVPSSPNTPQKIVQSVISQSIPPTLSQQFSQQQNLLPPRQQLTPLNQTTGALYSRPLNQSSSTSNNDQQGSRRTSVKYDSLPIQSNPLVQPTQQDLPVSVPRQQQIPPTSALKPLDQRTTLDKSKKLAESRMWRYASALPNFEKAIQSNNIDEALEHLKSIFEIFLKSVDLGFPNSPHFEELPEKLAKPLCNSINFDELNNCYDLVNRFLRIEPSGRNLFNQLLSWIFQWRTESNDNDTNKYKAFELLRVIMNCTKQADGNKVIHVKARTKLNLSQGTAGLALDTMGSININLSEVIELYTTYLNFEITRDKTSFDIEEFKQRWLEDLAEKENNVFLAMVPQLLKYWSNIFVGNSRFIYMIVSGVNPVIIYKFETDLRQQKYKVIGNVEDVDSFLGCALEWEPFQQIYLFNLIRSEYGNDVIQTEKFMNASTYLKSLDPLSNPEALSGLIWLLETVPPTVKIIEALFEIMIPKTDVARFEVINYINSIFHTWQKNTTNMSLLKSNLESYFDNLNTEDNKDEIKAAVELMDDLWKKAHPTLKRELSALQPKVETLAASIGIHIKFFNVFEEPSNEKHMESEENDDENSGNSRSSVLSISKKTKSQDRKLRSTTVQSRNTANEQTTSTSDGEENEEETSHRTPSPPVQPKRVKRKIIVTSSEEEQEVEQPNNRKSRSSRARSLAQRTTSQTSRKRKKVE
ncbi:3600_t:CDS:10 [Scutellospora calospora]|uniref:3600_t:CDS:1 n=1 Tax=Scutellospora calospora TaxID=85575 RepID=A0ACA9K0Z9_9GLOM|nr:3600_t:CDS:10 [Scutellospora calospora]